MTKEIAVLEDDTSLVYLRNPIAVAKYKLSQIQQKVFIEIALMAKKSPETVYYKLYIRDFQKKTDSTTNDTTAIKLQIKEMAHIPIYIEKTKTGGVVDATIFASVERFEDSPREYVEIEISQKVKPYFIEFADGEYFKYEIKNTRKLKSVYSIRLYLFLKSWKRVGKIIVSYQELRNIADVSDSEYKLFGDFHKRVIKAAVDELKEKTDLSFDYTLERQRKKSQNSPVKNIHFKIHDNGLDTPELEQPQDITPLAIEPDSELVSLANKIEPVSELDLANLVDLYSRDRVVDVLILANEEHSRGNKIRSLIPYLHNALKNKSAVGRGKKQQQAKAKQSQDKQQLRTHKEIEAQLSNGLGEFKSKYLLQLGTEAPQPVKDAFWAKLQEEVTASPGLKKLYFDKKGNPMPDQIRIALGMELNTRSDQQLSIDYMQALGKPIQQTNGHWAYVTVEK